VRKKLLSIAARHIGAEPVDNFGQIEPKPTTTIVEDIWSVEYCRQHPQNASEAIKSLQTLLSDREEQVAALKHAIEDIRKLLDERI
jgi:hypothetical protein